MSRPKTKTTKPRLRQTRWDLVKTTGRHYRGHWLKYALAAGIIFIPSSVINAYTSTSSNAIDFSIVLYVAGLFCLLALFWLAQNRAIEPGRVRDLYVASSRRFLPFLMVSLVLSVTALPLVAGAFVMVLAAAYGASGWLIALGALLCLVTIYFIVRLSLALPAVIDQQHNWRRSLARSYRLSRKRWWHLFWNYLTYLLTIGVVSTLIISLFTSVGAIKNSPLLSGLVNGIVLMVTLPILIIFLSVIYENLGQAYDTSQSR